VIDLRGNTGGNSTLGDILLSYCALPDSIYYYSADVCICELYLKNYQVNMEDVKKSLAIERGIILEDVTLPYVIKSVGDKPVKATSEYMNYWKANNGKETEPREPRKPFDGKIILLIGSNTFSSASDFATICKDNGLAIIYGTPTGGQPSCYGDILSFTLPNTGLKCGVSYKYFRRPDFRKDPEDALYPDVFLALDPDSHFKGKDILWERVLQDIRTDKVPDIAAR
jgi:C-terminal processing protease CtpA/Prc